ncbi:MAG TPA: beta/gamma crystallin-related protein, partial [Dongiaceae bacterium]
MRIPLTATAALVAAAAALCIAPLLAHADEPALQLAQAADGSLVLYSEDLYQGSRQAFEAEQSNLSGAGWNNQAESLSIRPGDIWEICAETEFKDCRRIEANVPDLGKLGLNKKISSIRPIKQIDPTFVKPLEGRTAGFFPTPRANDAPIAACPSGGTSKKCVQKQANQFCADNGYKDSAYFVNNEGV